jgi:hypothetical protein
VARLNPYIFGGLVPIREWGKKYGKFFVEKLDSPTQKVLNGG